MTGKAAKAAATRARILGAAGQGFRAQGYGGLGVDGLARDAGVTSGAFYAHFDSKAAAFAAAVEAGLETVRASVERLREAAGPGWITALTELYLADKRLCPIGEACALPSLSGEIERSSDEVRTAYRRKLLEIVAAMVDGQGGDALCEADAWALLALFAGGITMARAVDDPAVSEAITTALRRAAHGIGSGRLGPLPERVAPAEG